MNKVEQSASVQSEGRSIGSLIDDLAATLTQSGIAGSRRGASDVIAALLDVPRSWPLANGGITAADAAVEGARRAVGLLCRGAPFAYAVGSASFRHLTLVVDERVMIPRPETEILVGEVMARMEALHGAHRWGTAIDVGTGSGAIALSLATEGRFDRIIATDASADALDVAQINRHRSAGALGCPIEFRHGSLMAPVRGATASVVVSNPPYIAFSEIEALTASVRDWEPPIALFSGHDGMAATEAIVAGAAELLGKGGLLALEVDVRRASLVAEMAMRDGRYREVGVGLDLTGCERFVFASRV